MPKAKASAFMVFAMEYKEREESKGRKFPSVAEVVKAAGKFWEKMDNNERAPYQEKAKESKKQARENGELMTAVGIPYSQVDAEMRAKQSKSERISSRIISMIDKAVDSNALPKLEFYFVCFNHFCCLVDGKYIPAELGVVRYSLAAGVIDKFHTLIDPGALPLGYAYAAMSHSQNEHQLPIPPSALGESNYETIAVKLLEFLSTNGSEMPLLFTDREDVEKVENMLDDILKDVASEPDLLVCPLSEMFHYLRRSTRLVAGLDSHDIPPAHVLQHEIEKDVYEYTSYISCAFHEEIAAGKYCALSRCVRWVFLVSEYCCLDLDIEMQPGKHLPPRADSVLSVPLLTAFNALSFGQAAKDEKPKDNGAKVDSTAQIPGDFRQASKKNNGDTPGSSRASDNDNAVQSSSNAIRKKSNDAMLEALPKGEPQNAKETVQKSTINPWAGPPTQLLGAGRGSLRVARNKIHAITQAGRGQRLGMEEFPPLG